jgi:CrcB protein
VSLDEPDEGRRRHHDPHPGFPVDPDVTGDDLPRLHERAARLLIRRRDILGVIALGGAVGSLARWSVARALPHGSGEFPWSTLTVNVTGCFVLGVLMVLVVERWPDRRLLRPFVGTGLLGGYTTFSTYALDTRSLVAADRPAIATAYLIGTLGLGLVAVVAGLRATERVLR